MTQQDPNDDVIKTCPFLGRECIKDECALFIKVTHQQVVLGIRKVEQAGVCSLVALSMIMSSKAPPPPMQKINLQTPRGN